MPSIGDWVTPTLTVTPFDGTTAAALIITLPDGTTANGTGETTANSGATWTADPVALTASGVWALNWTVTGTGKSAEPQQIVVSPALAGAELAAPLATIADLVAHLGRPLTATQLAQAPGKLASASTKIRGYCRRTFSTLEDDEIVLRPVGSTLRLPQRPVTAVTLLEQIGTAGTVDRTMSVSEWSWDGIDLIELWPDPCVVDGIAPTGSYANTYRATYDYGSGAVPEFVKDMCVEMVCEVLEAVTATPGLITETIGQYSYRLAEGAPGPTPRLTKERKKDLVLAGFRRTAGTIQLRMT